MANNVSVVGIADKKTQQALLALIGRVTDLEKEKEELRIRIEKLERKG